MRWSMQQNELRLDRFTRGTLAVIAMLLVVIAVELWGTQPSSLPTAQAQIPDSGRQRMEMIDEARRTNDLLAEILGHLRTKPVKVQMESTDSSRDDARASKQAKRVR